MSKMAKVELVLSVEEEVIASYTIHIKMPFLDKGISEEEQEAYYQAMADNYRTSEFMKQIAEGFMTGFMTAIPKDKWDQVKISLNSYVADDC